jgi:hypothetical protein
MSLPKKKKVLHKRINQKQEQITTALKRIASQLQHCSRNK